METSLEDKIQPTETVSGPLWARMAGFPLWPGRRCSEYEEASMKTPKSTKVKQVLVLFLGTRRDKAWILEASVAPFTAATLDKNFLPKKFKADKDYRAAVVEATRLAQQAGDVFDAAYLELLDTSKHDFPLALGPTEACVSCGGSGLSGELMACHTCSQRQRHWHCYDKADEGAWMCDQCCELQHLPLGSVVPFENDPLPSSDADTTTFTLPLTTSSSSLTKVAKVGVTQNNRPSASGRSGGSLLKKVSASLGQGIEPPMIPLVSNGSNRSLMSGKTSYTGGILNTPHTPTRSGTQSNTSSPEQTVRKTDTCGIDDECFVCGLGGQLLLCDFPQCVRAYHQVCVARIFPESLDSILGPTDAELLGSGSSGGSMNSVNMGGCTSGGVHNMYNNNTPNYTTIPTNANSLAEPWFCPSHTCVGCHALHTTTNTLAVVDTPAMLVSQQLFAVQCSIQATSSRSSTTTSTTNSSTTTTTNTNTNTTSTAAPPIALVYKPQPSHTRNTLRQKALRSCSTCPFAVCGECEVVLGGGGGVLHQKRFVETLECLNCASRDPRLKLARLLEKAWVKSCNSRLALPFLRPLLPVVGVGSAGSGGCVGSIGKDDGVVDSVVYGDRVLDSAVDGVMVCDGNESSTSSSDAIVSTAGNGTSTDIASSIETSSNTSSSEVHSNSSSTTNDPYFTTLTPVRAITSANLPSNGTNNTIDTSATTKTATTPRHKRQKGPAGDVLIANGSVGGVNNTNTITTIADNAEIATSNTNTTDSAASITTTRTSSRLSTSNTNTTNTSNTTSNASTTPSKSAIGSMVGMPNFNSLVHLYGGNIKHNTGASSNISTSSNGNISSATTTNNANTTTNTNKRTRDTTNTTLQALPTVPTLPTLPTPNTIKPTQYPLCRAIKPTSRPADLVGVLEKVHRLEYSSVREFYADLNYIRNILQDRVTSISSNGKDRGDNSGVPNTENTATASSTNTNNSVIMSYDTIVDESYAFLTSKMMQVQNYEARIAMGESGNSGIGGSGSNIVIVNSVHDLCSGSNGCMEVVNGDTTGSTTNTRVSRHNTNPTTSAVVSAVTIATMLRLWRVECAYTVPSAVVSSILYGTHIPHRTNTTTSNTNSTSTSSTTTTHNVPFSIAPRTLPSWHYFLDNGVMPPLLRGTTDPYTMLPVIQKHQQMFKNSVDSTSSGNSGSVVREMLYGCGDPQFAKYATNEMHAAQLMLGMAHNQQREDLTLFEGAPGIAAHHSRHPLYYGVGGSSGSGNKHAQYQSEHAQQQLAEDDQLLILDRLREVTQKAVQLEERLRQQALTQRRSLLHTDTATVTIGQASVLSELKLANDNLRWRLQQKCSVVNAQQAMIESLQRQLAEERGARGSGGGSGGNGRVGGKKGSGSDGGDSNGANSMR